MAAYDIQKHFKELRVETGRRRGRDPFATGFEDETEEKKNSRRTKTKAPSPEKPIEASVKPVRSSSSDDDLLDPKGTQPSLADRRLSPAPAQLAASRVSDGAQRTPFDKRSSLGAKAQAGGILAYLDDSDEEGALAPPTSRGNRRPSPAPVNTANPPQHTRRASSPQADTEKPAIPRHTVASPFAGTKYLQDSDSDSDEEAVTSRHGSTDTTNDPNSDIDDGLGPLYSTNRREQAQNRGGKKRKKQNGSGVDWRAFSVSRQEQRSAELETLQANLRRRGKRISFGTHARTDDGEQVPVAPSAVQPSGPGNIPRPSRARGRARSPPRRGEDVEPTADEAEDGEGGVERYDPTTHKTNPFTGQAVRRRGNSNPIPPAKAFDSKGPGNPHASLPDIRIDDISLRSA